MDNGVRIEGKLCLNVYEIQWYLVKGIFRNEDVVMELQ